MRNILGLDLGTNSIGWAKISIEEEGANAPKIELGSRIIPMSQDVLGKFDSGVTESQTALRTSFRGTRRLRERCLLRRERLLRVLHLMKFLPQHYDNAIGWDKTNNKTYGKFIDESEPKLAWKKGADGKMQFLFMDSFNEMIADFAITQPSLVAEGKRLPLDWTLFYLRDKALTKPVSKEELAWILLNFNQKRGYYQLRGEDAEDNDKNKKEEYYELVVTNVEATDEKKGKAVWYNITLENGWVYRRASETPLFDWKDKVHEFIVTTEFNEDGSVKTDKEGKPKRSFRAPKADDWTLQKKRIENSIESSGLTVGSYIYRHLLVSPFDKIRGKLIKTIERDYYKEELIQILKKQEEYHKELSDMVLLKECACELYANNIPHQSSLASKDLNYLLVEDLLFYQRPLKTKKSLIANCPYESYKFVDKETGEIKIQHIKCIAKSNPYFQEFRLWQFVQNLRLFDTNAINEQEVTKQYLSSEEDYVRLFEFLNARKDITQDALVSYFGIKKPRGKDAKSPIRWNYVVDKSYPCNETRYIMLSVLKKANIDSSVIDDKEFEYKLWHLLYSVNDRKELLKALKALASKNNLPESLATEFVKVQSFKKEYGAYSEKAIKKLLTVMRTGSLWDEHQLPEEINKVISGEFDEKILSRMQHQNICLDDVRSFKFLPVWLACYVVYGRHSEAQDIQNWQNPEALQSYINGFKQYSLRNPIVEQCILETLRTVHDIWVKCGHIDEIHVELGRSMKNNPEQRARMSARNLENENTNMRIKQLLLELKNDPAIADVRPYSPMQHDILRIYEEGALMELKADDKDYAEISRISKLATPTSSEITKYKLWLEQKYVSPYTGRTISLSKLFTSAYQIEHIIPQSRYFDDSLTNKVICEAEVNQLKDNSLGLEFIKKHKGEIVYTAAHGNVKIFTEAEYKAFVEEHYVSHKVKAQKLMMEDIPESFIQRQMNDSRYISRVIIGLLSNVVREDGEIDSVSKNVIPCTGGITDKLKQDWGLNDVWNTIVYPRFERLNQLTGSDTFGHWEDKDGKRVFQTTMPLELQKGFSKKRIDHRHHAMDALVIALASRNIVNYLNNESAKDTKRREDLRMLLCDKNRIIRKPWPSFTQDAKEALMNVVVSFKHYIRVINKASNYYEHYSQDGKKEIVVQNSNSQWAVRKPLHKDTFFGQVNLRKTKELQISKALEQVDNIADKTLRHQIRTMLKNGWNNKQVAGQLKSQGVAKTTVYYFTDNNEPMVATRKALDDTFDQKRIESITDTGIQTILKNYLEAKDNNPKIAFSPEGIIELNQNIKDYNNGKNHQPILRVRVCEPKGEKYNIGSTGVNRKKFVEAQSGTNLYFAIYENEGVRSYATIPLNIVVERLKQGLSPVPEVADNGTQLKFYISPNDLVYVPTEDEMAQQDIVFDNSRIYKFVDSSGTTANFIPGTSAGIIFHVQKSDAGKYSSNMIQDEYGVGSPQSKNQKSFDGTMIKSVCWKLETDRLGNIIKVIR